MSLENHGSSWTPEQEDWLVKCVKKKKTLEWCAEQLKRTPGSIRARLLKIAVTKINAGESIETISKHLNMSKEDIEEYIVIEASRQETRKAQATTKPSNLLSEADLNAFMDRENLNEEQKVGVRKFHNGDSILLTGPAGTGKSFTIKSILELSQRMYKKVGVTALTGSAALLIGGRTLHSYLKIGLAKSTPEEMADTVKTKFKLVASKIRNIDALIIDEVSMMNAELFKKVSKFLAIIRDEDNAPFGSLQMILCGDFVQIPPIEGQYCFLSPEWELANIQTVLLTTLVRQDGDTRFQEILSRSRWGELNDQDIITLRSLKSTKFPNGIQPTRLYALNRDVDRINDKKFQELLSDGRPVVELKTTYSNPTARKWATEQNIPEKISMCVGAQVVITWNIDADKWLVNGTRGVVQEVDDDSITITTAHGTHTLEAMTLMVDNDHKTNIKIIPIKLAYACSFHKSQGMTLDAVELDLGDSIFQFGQAYTGLSRARSLASIRVLRMSSSSFRTDPAVKAFYGQTS